MLFFCGDLLWVGAAQIGIFSEFHLFGFAVGML
jgi:hypothetical protein